MKYSKRERCRCPHGKIYWMRWQWEDNSSIENSEPDGYCNCKLCKQERIGD